MTELARASHGSIVVAAMIVILTSISCKSNDDKRELPVLSAVGKLTFVDQDGRSVTQDALRGKVWAAAFMFTRCPTICPTVTRGMRSVQVAAARAGAPIHLVSFTVDPDHDTPEVLKRYAGEYDADLASWSFLTGESSTIRKTAEEGFKIGVSGSADPKKEHYGITHGSHMILVDAQLNIRGYYRTSEQAALDQLVRDAARLRPSSE